MGAKVVLELAIVLGVVHVHVEMGAKVVVEVAQSAKGGTSGVTDCSTVAGVAEFPSFGLDGTSSLIKGGRSEIPGKG